MASYRVVISRKVRKDFKRIPPQDAMRILEAIQALADAPRSPDSKKLKGEELYRIRIGGYRVVYEIRDEELVVIVVKVGHRKDVYRS